MAEAEAHLISEGLFCVLTRRCIKGCLHYVAPGGRDPPNICTLLSGRVRKPHEIIRRSLGAKEKGSRMHAIEDLA